MEREGRTHRPSRGPSPSSAVSWFIARPLSVVGPLAINTIRASGGSRLAICSLWWCSTVRGLGEGGCSGTADDVVTAAKRRQLNGGSLVRWPTNGGHFRFLERPAAAATMDVKPGILLAEKSQITGLSRTLMVGARVNGVSSSLSGIRVCVRACVCMRACAVVVVEVVVVVVVLSTACLRIA